MTNKPSKKTLNLFSLIALIIVAVLIVVNNLLPIIGITISGILPIILNTVKDFLILLVVGISAYDYVAKKSQGWQITYWVSVIVFIVGIVLAWL